jgi:hypothetical protein
MPTYKIIFKCKVCGKTFTRTLNANLIHKKLEDVYEWLVLHPPLHPCKKNVHGFADPIGITKEAAELCEEDDLNS